MIEHIEHISEPVPLVSPAQDRRLRDLAQRAAASHAMGVQHSRLRLESYRDAGKALCEAKKFVGHGGWLSWLERNVLSRQRNDGTPCFTERMAQRYMRLAEVPDDADLEAEWKRICRREDSGEGKNDTVSDLPTPPHDVFLSPSLAFRGSGCISFLAAPDREALRVEPDGRFFVGEAEVPHADGLAVYAAFRAWLEAVTGVRLGADPVADGPQIMSEAV